MELNFTWLEDLQMYRIRYIVHKIPYMVTSVWYDAYLWVSQDPIPQHWLHFKNLSALKILYKILQNLEPV